MVTGELDEAVDRRGVQEPRRRLADLEGASDAGETREAVGGDLNGPLAFHYALGGTRHFGLRANDVAFHRLARRHAGLRIRHFHLRQLGRLLGHRRQGASAQQLVVCLDHRGRDVLASHAAPLTRALRFVLAERAQGPELMRVKRLAERQQPACRIVLEDHGIEARRVFPALWREGDALLLLGIRPVLDDGRTEDRIRSASRDFGALLLRRRSAQGFVRPESRADGFLERQGPGLSEDRARPQNRGDAQDHSRDARATDRR